MRQRVFLITLFVGYAMGRAAIVLQGKVFTSFDTFSYAYRDDPAWDRGALVSFTGHAPRPWGSPPAAMRGPPALRGGGPVACQEIP